MTDSPCIDICTTDSETVYVSGVVKLQKRLQIGQYIQLKKQKILIELKRRNQNIF